MGGGQIIAVDSIYKAIMPNTSYENILLECDFLQTIQSHKADLLFISDVLHHLNNTYIKKIFSNIKNIPFIVIKDIDANHSFGNFANKMHDLIINQEKTINIYPQSLIEILESYGYDTHYQYLPKLWYPHFLLIAKTSKAINQ